MPTTLNQAGFIFNDNSVMNGAFNIRAVRVAYSESQFTNSGQYASDYLNVEVTMPATNSNNSRYLILGESNTDDSNSSTKGAGVMTWVNVAGVGDYWVHRPGTHSKYHSGGADKYYTLHSMCIDDGANTVAIAAGQVRKYRLYGQNHNGNVYWNAGVGNQYGPRTKLIVIEFDQSTTS